MVRQQKLPFLSKISGYLPAPVALTAVLSRDKTKVYASSDMLFRGAMFGRDSIEVAEDILPYNQQLAHNIIISLACLQGEQNDAVTEEEPGKIIHEYRTRVVDGKPIDGLQKKIFEQLGMKWGGTHDELRYYGSVDATPDFVRLVDAYTLQYDDALLDETVTLHRSATCTVRDVVERALGWIDHSLAASRSGFIEFRRRNPHGIANQVWKDSEEFYIHANGEMANHDQPIASIEVQGSTYDALLASKRLTGHDRNAAAEALRQRLFELLWREDGAYFALGTDITPADGKLRCIETVTANPGALLDTALFDGLPVKQQQTYVGGIIETIFGADFLTDAGIRSRSLTEAAIVPFWDYHGSYVTWPKETYDIARGLRRQGFPRLAVQLENRISNLITRRHQYPEFVYVDSYGRVLDSSPTPHQHGEIIVVNSPNDPERLQAWTISAMYAIIKSSLPGAVPPRSLANPPSDAWRKTLENAILSRIPKLGRYTNPVTLALKYPSVPYRRRFTP